jgi:hypothetical protein
MKGYELRTQHNEVIVSLTSINVSTAICVEMLRNLLCTQYLTFFKKVSFLHLNALLLLDTK